MKFYKLVLLLVILAFVPYLMVYAENNAIKKGDVLTLEKCIDIATGNNPSITLGKNISRVYQSKIGQSKSLYLPQVNISTGYSRQNPITDAVIDKDSNQYSGSVGLNQLIYDFGKTGTKTKIQKLNLDSSISDVDFTVINVAYNVKQAYYTALAGKINRDIYAQSINAYEDHLRQAKAFFEIGTKSKIDVTTAEVNLSNAKLNFIKANNAYKSAISSLNNAMGIPDAPEYYISDTLTFKHIIDSENDVDYSVDSSNELMVTNKNESKNSHLKSKISKFDIIDNLSFKKYEVNFDDALKKAYDNRPDLKALVIKESAASESVKLVRKDYFPTVSGFANYGLGGQRFPVDNGWSFGTNVSIPLFNGLLTKNQVDEAKANLDIARSNIEILKQNIYHEVQQAYINLVESENRIPVSYIAVKQAKENLDLANGRYNVGVGNSIEVQDAQINYNNAQLSYIQSLYDYNIARSNLEKDMGVK